MRKALIALLATGVLLAGVSAYAHMWGGPGGYGGEGYDSKALDETVDLRKSIHEKRFEYMEALRTGDEKKTEALEKELEALEKELYEKTGSRGPRRGFGGRGMGYGYGPGMMGYSPGACWGPQYR